MSITYEGRIDLKKLVVLVNGKARGEFPLNEAYQQKLFVDFLSSYYGLGEVSPSGEGPSSLPEIRASTDFVVKAEGQRGAKQVISWKGHRVTGNLVATLQAINSLETAGKQYKSTNDLLPYLSRNDRFQLNVTTRSLQGQIRWLTSKGLFDSARLTPLGKRMAEAVKIMEKPDPVDSSDEQEVENSDEEPLSA